MNLTLLFTMTTFLAEFDENTIKKLLDLYKSIFNRSNLFMDVLHWLGWALVKGLCWVVNVCKALMDIAFETLNFMDFTELTQFSSAIKPIAFTLLTISIGYLAYVYLLASEKPKTLGVNIAMLVITMVLLPWVMSTMNKVVIGTKDAVMHSDDSSAWSVVQPYVTDLYYLDGKNFYYKDNKFDLKGKEVNGYANKIENLESIDIQEKMDMEDGDYDVTNENLFKKYLAQDKEGNPTLQKIKGSTFLDPPWYYRYKVDYLLIYLNLLAIALVYILTSIKVIMLMFELVTEKVIAPFFATGDLVSGQKVKTILTGILNAYITLFIILFLQKLFFIWSNYVSVTTFTDNIAEGFIKALLILAGALFIVDGPNICEKVLGIDAGLKSVGQSIQSAYYASQMADSIIKGGVNTVKGVANAGGKIAETVGDGIKAVGNVLAGAGGVAYETIKADMQKQASNTISNNTTEGVRTGTATEQTENASSPYASTNDASNTIPQASPQATNSPSANIKADNGTNKAMQPQAPVPNKNPQMAGNDVNSQNQTSGGVTDYLKQELSQKAGQTQLGQSFNKGRELGQAINNSLANRSNNNK